VLQVNPTPVNQGFTPILIQEGDRNGKIEMLLIEFLSRQFEPANSLTPLSHPTRRGFTKIPFERSANAAWPSFDLHDVFDLFPHPWR
jgi:hypothetical protein